MAEQGKLFDTEPAPAQDTGQDATDGGDARTEAFKLLREVRQQWEQSKGTGRYVLLPTEALTLRAEAYYKQYVPDVGNLLNTSGVPAETIGQVLRDYGYTLMGFYSKIALSLSEQENVLAAVKPWKPYLTERYGLTLLFFIYYYNVTTADDYINNFKNATGEVQRTTTHADGSKETELFKFTVEEQKADYLRRTIYRIASGTTPMLASAYRWIGRNYVENEKGELFDIVHPSDFTGVEPELSNKYFSYIEAGAGLDYYANYYYIAKYALHAPPEELKEIDAPPIYGTPERVQEYAERIANQRYKNIQERAAEIEKAIDAETAEEREKARQEFTTATQDTIRIPETFALLSSRDVYASVDGTPQMGKGILPIQAFITDYMTRHHLTEQVTPRTVEKVIEGINLLQRLYNVKPNEKGQYTFETNLSEFAELIGYKDANQTQKVEIMRALQVLDGLYLAVWRSEGLKAVRVFTIQEIGITGVYAGKLTLQVNAETMKGRPNLISYKDFDEMRKNAKGQAENHFRGQILAKGQKEENALLNEVFGYDTLLKEIEVSGGTAEEIAKAKRNIDKHKSRDKRRIAKWYEDYKQKGWLLGYTYARNGKGEYIYKWRRGNIPQDDADTSTPQEPDEQ